MLQLSCVNVGSFYSTSIRHLRGIDGWLLVQNEFCVAWRAGPACCLHGRTVAS